MNKTFKEYEEENTIICPNCNMKIKTNIIPMNFFDNIHEDMYISHEAEYLERKKLQDRLDKTTKEVKELYEMAKEQDSENVNLIDRLELILKIIGENNENR